MKIFLGYPRENLDDAKRVYEFLIGLGLTVWFDKKSIVGGDKFRREREKNQGETDQILYVFSDVVHSRPGEIQRELKQALEDMKAQPFGANYFIPLRAEVCRLPKEFSDYNYIDLFDEKWKLNLCLSIQKRHTQITESQPKKLTDYIDEQFLRGGKKQVRLVDDNEVRRIEVNYFRYTEDEPYFEFINSHISAFALTSFYRERRDIGAIVEGSPPKTHSFFWECNVEEHFRKEDLVSLRYWQYEYTGGAHPNHWVITQNFGGKNFGQLFLRDLFPPEKETLRFLIDQIKKNIENQFEGDAPFNVDFEQEIANENWKLLEKFNFDTTGIMFSFSPYVILPYVTGITEVRIVWTAVAERMEPSVRTGIFSLLGHS